MSSADDREIGLFPLQLVLLPGEVAPLHVFEERYKRLIGACRAADDVFGIVLATDEGIGECGCAAGIFQVLEEFDDGRLNILVDGRERFRILELRAADDDAEYTRARVVLFSDDDELPDEPNADLVGSARVLFRRLAGLMGVEEPRVPEGAEPLSFRLAAAVDFGLPLKQRLLESRSELERLELLVTVMKALIPGLELRKEREEAIRGNGKGN